MKKITPRRVPGGLWLARQDSNLNKESQNLLCYRYTTGHRGRSLLTGFLFDVLTQPSTHTVSTFVQVTKPSANQMASSRSAASGESLP